MKEYLYRGKRKDNQEWIYGYLANNNHIAVFANNGLYIDNYMIDERTIGQYTCLQDKENKKIFEGDIISYKNTDNKLTKAIVGFSQGSFTTWIKDGDIPPHPIMLTYKDCLVIGNVFDE